jgi:hypothetical protein
MVQTAGRVNVVVKDEKFFYQYDGTRLEGDGSTAFDVDPKEAANLALAGSLVVASDVKQLAADYTTSVTSIQNANRP